MIAPHVSDTDALYLIKVGEIHLKDGNRTEFDDRLKYDIKHRLAGIKTELSSREGRFYLRIDEKESTRAEYVLSHTPGVNGWARAHRVRKDIESIEEATATVISPYLEAGPQSFKIEARRSDKGFPLDSYGVAREIGGRLLRRFPGLSVDVHTPALVVNIEIREKAYVFILGGSGVRGLPVGSGGRGLLLLSGGIDSPVAGFRMLSRGLALESLHFHSYPYTSREAWEKVRDLASTLACYAGGMLLHTLSFTDVQLKIQKDAREEYATLYLRACMMMAADMVAKKLKLNSIVTGESLGQVASQTAENMRFTGSFTDMALLRPLVGTDKEDIMRQARTIGTYDLSIQPYDDCCVLFTPKHPVLKAAYEKSREEFLAMGFEKSVAETIDSMNTVRLPCAFTPLREP